jgi:hypothetical protein
MKKDKSGYYTWWCFFITLVAALGLSGAFPEIAVQLFFVGFTATLVITVLLTYFKFNRKKHRSYLIMIPFFIYLLLFTYILISIPDVVNKVNAILIGSLLLFAFYYLSFKKL